MRMGPQQTSHDHVKAVLSKNHELHEHHIPQQPRPSVWPAEDTDGATARLAELAPPRFAVTV